MSGAALVLAVFTLPALLADPEPAGRGRRPLRPPTALTAEGRCSGFLDAEVALTWEPTVSRFADGYEVYRGDQSGGPYDRVGYVPGHGSTSYLDDDVDDGATYFYVVKATTGRRDSPPTEQVLVDTPGACFF